MANQDPVQLANAAQLLDAARLALSSWLAPDESRPGDRVRAGHDTAALIDDLMAELHTQRARLIGELREDRLTRDSRVDELLANYAAAGYTAQEIAVHGNSGPGGPFPGSLAADDTPTEIRRSRDFWGNPS